MNICTGASAGVVGVSGRELFPKGTTAMVCTMEVFRNEEPHVDLLCDTDLVEEMGFGDGLVGDSAESRMAEPQSAHAM